MLTPLGDRDPRQIGPYRIQGLLGRGGMGAVYLGFSPADKAVAVKVPAPALARDEQFRVRFRREVDAAQRVRGRAVAAVLDADADSDRPWMATEYVEGKSLAEAVAERGRLDERLATGLAVGLAEALVAIHDAGVVHRDLKPANIVLAWDGPRVIDFGVASASDQTRHTSTGTLIGTVVWMAPEQLRGERAGPPADIFAWGACVAFGATGQAPFRAAAPEAVGVKILREAPDLSGVPLALLPMVRAALDKNPARRPRAAELLDRLLRGGAVEDALGETTEAIPAGAAGADAYATALGRLWDLPGGTPPGSGQPVPHPGQRTPPPTRSGPGFRATGPGYGSGGGGYGASGPGGYQESGYRDPGPNGATAGYRAGGYPPAGTAASGRTPPPPAGRRRSLTTVLLALGFVLVLGGAATAALLLVHNGGTPQATATTGTVSVPPASAATTGTTQTSVAPARLTAQDLGPLVVARGYTGYSLDLRTFDPNRDLNVVIGSKPAAVTGTPAVSTTPAVPDGESAGPQGTTAASTSGCAARDMLAFVFTAYRFEGTDFRVPSRHISVVSTTSRAIVLRYATYPRTARDCDPSGSAKVRFTWTGSALVVDPATPVPTADLGADGSRR